MSLIIAYKTEDKMHVGFDSKITGYDSTKNFKLKKAFFANEDKSLVLGAVGSVGHLNMLEFLNDFTKHNEFRQMSLKEFIYRHLIPALREEAKLCFPEGDEEKYNSSILVASKDEVFIISELSFILEPEDNFHAIGSGKNHADAILTVLKNIDMPIEDKIQLALEIPAKYVLSVGGPFEILTIENEIDRTPIEEPEEEIEGTNDK